MNSRFQCSGCRNWFPVAEARSVGSRRVCSEDCIQTVVQKSRLKLQPRVSPVSAGERSHSKRPSRSQHRIPTSIRAEVKGRDRDCCCWCGTSQGIHIHHINYRSQGGSDEPSNLISLCHEHHALVHSSKRAYQPLCRGYIWLVYVHGVRLHLPHIQTLLDSLD